MLSEIACRSSGLPQQYVMQQYIRAPKNAVIKGWRPRLPQRVKKSHPMVKMLAERCWEHDPTKRPTFKQVKMHLEVIGNQPKRVAAEFTAEEKEEEREIDDFETRSAEKLAEMVRNSQLDALSVEQLAEILRSLPVRSVEPASI